MRVASVNPGGRPVVGRVAVHAHGLAPGPGPGPGLAGLSNGASEPPWPAGRHPSSLGRVYAYPQLHYRFWQTVRAQARVAAWDAELAPGALGEELTLAGLDESDLWVGDRLVLPGCVLAVSEPRLPGPELAAQLGFAQAVKLYAQSGYCGAFLAVVEAGDVGAGDALQLVPGAREVNVRELFRARVGTG